MGAEIEEVILEAYSKPLASRRPLFRGILGAPTYLLRVGSEELADDDVRVLAGAGAEERTSSLAVWAEGDALLGGVWVPVFTSEEKASTYVAARGLRHPPGKQLQWVRHEPGQVYGLLETIPCFAGVYLNPEKDGGVRLEWLEVNALSESRVPPEAPLLRSLPDEECALPEGIRCRVGHLDRKVFGFDGRQVIFPEFGNLELQDFRSLVQLRLEDGDSAWAPCRHFAAVLRRLLERCRERASDCEDLFLQSLILFEMYGEAEAACSRLAVTPERRSYALDNLALVFRRSGRIENCVDVCRHGLREFPAEAPLYRNLVLALAQLEDLEGARKAARQGLGHFPDDATLQRFV
ncbi:MAG: hypothetical protein A2X36_06445 [Elusimicrobia bacterium GWA2_69_24]|nr:MAG: hypothetical protein A2X36_06445 [Elusimicrobia bacterium GWA2_69_24]